MAWKRIGEAKRETWKAERNNKMERKKDNDGKAERTGEKKGKNEKRSCGYEDTYIG